ncbi:hypothetical protein J5837_16070 [Pseudoxanthomonas helianthi]|uniref:Uncharacterized protein n=1 Tax=Pseudoxanthomonas helianthi TaxID=1453541 RepID=A0A941B1D8_9GAMM|nr:hypothetical protein [Pseudoxanthomonas helianthi]MBP3985923.1 hypothetical protein [Pseudoxanthomonas helianthi]
MSASGSRAYCRVSALIFSVVALLQVYRASLGLPLAVGQFEIPVAASWFAAVVAGAMAIWGWRQR